MNFVLLNTRNTRNFGSDVYLVCPTPLDTLTIRVYFVHTIKYVQFPPVTFPSILCPHFSKMLRCRESHPPHAVTEPLASLDESLFTGQVLFGGRRDRQIE